MRNLKKEYLQKVTPHTICCHITSGTMLLKRPESRPWLFILIALGLVKIDQENLEALRLFESLLGISIISTEYKY